MNGGQHQPEPTHALRLRPGHGVATGQTGPRLSGLRPDRGSVQRGVLQRLRSRTQEDHAGSPRHACGVSTEKRRRGPQILFLIF